MDILDDNIDILHDDHEEIIRGRRLGRRGCVNVVSIPSGAKIIIDGIDKGVTPRMITYLDIGEHTYSLSLEGYEEKTGTFNTVRHRTSLIVEKLHRDTGDLYITSSPESANIYIDGVYQNTSTPALLTNLEPGIHTYKLELENYDDKVGTFIIIAGQTSTVTETFIIGTPYPNLGTLDISSVPNGAMIYINDIYQNVVTPSVIPNLPAGVYVFKLVLEGYYDKSGVFSIYALETTTIKQGLIPIS